MCRWFVIVHNLALTNLSKKGQYTFGLQASNDNMNQWYNAKFVAGPLKFVLTRIDCPPVSIVTCQCGTMVYFVLIVQAAKLIIIICTKQQHDLFCVTIPVADRLKQKESALGVHLILLLYCILYRPTVQLYIFT